MRVIAERVWNEPAAAIGLLVSVGLLAWAIISDADFDAETIISILAPLASALGIRQLVSPATGPRSSDENPPAAA